VNNLIIDYNINHFSANVRKRNGETRVTGALWTLEDTVNYYTYEKEWRKQFMDRYPGGSHVDIVSLDYYINPLQDIDGSFVFNANTAVEIIGRVRGLVLLAQTLGKIPVLAETGVSNNQYIYNPFYTGFFKTLLNGIIEDSHASKIGYLLLWNSSPSSIMSPLGPRSTANVAGGDIPVFKSDKDFDYNTFQQYFSCNNPYFQTQICLLPPSRYVDFTSTNTQTFSNINGTDVVTLWSIPQSLRFFGSSNAQRGEIYFPFMWKGPIRIRIRVRSVSGSFIIKSIGLRNIAYGCYVGFIVLNEAVSGEKNIELTENQVSSFFSNDNPPTSENGYINMSCHLPEPAIGYRWETTTTSSSPASFTLDISVSFKTPI
jgi:hypothetical protein